jgi:putative Mg2+ transporter-C (MgtC) family protein
MPPILFSPDFFWPAMLSLALAVFCGGIIGLERQLRRKAVGIRSCIIVVLTTAFLTDLGLEATVPSGDPSRVMAAIITGVGFLGGGVIFSQGRRIQGITTASLIWALSAVGISIGFGHGAAAVVMTLVVMAVILIVDWAETRFPRLHREFEDQK